MRLLAGQNLAAQNLAAQNPIAAYRHEGETGQRGLRRMAHSKAPQTFLTALGSLGLHSGFV